MSLRNPTSWMWAQACDLLDDAEQVHRQFFRLAASGSTQALWEPPVDVFEDEREFIIVVALPGVARECVDISLESGSLVVRAERGIPAAVSRCAVRRLEIPYGFFERRIELPPGRFEVGTSECIDGCLVLRMRKTGPF